MYFGVLDFIPCSSLTERTDFYSSIRTVVPMVASMQFLLTQEIFFSNSVLFIALWFVPVMEFSVPKSENRNTVWFSCFKLLMEPIEKF